MLRNGDNLWVYIPNLKRATRVALRDSFQGGDFNNADVLRVNYEADYTGKLIDAGAARRVVPRAQGEEPGDVVRLHQAVDAQERLPAAEGRSTSARRAR